MTVLSDRENRELHYRGTAAHCWIAPVGMPQRAWEACVRAHLVSHILTGAREGDREGHRAAHQDLTPTAERWPAGGADIRTVEELGAALRAVRQDELIDLDAGLDALSDEDLRTLVTSALSAGWDEPEPPTREQAEEVVRRARHRADEDAYEDALIQLALDEPTASADLLRRVSDGWDDSLEMP